MSVEESVTPPDGPAESSSEISQPRHESPYPSAQTEQPAPQWLPPWWIRTTTQVAFVWGLGLGTANAAFWRDVATYGFAGSLVLLGTGLKAASLKVFQR